MKDSIGGPEAGGRAPTWLVVVRHGETEWSQSGRHTGRTDIPLTDRGRQQAASLGRALRGRTFSRVLSSPLERALDTCRLAGYSDRVEVVDDLREWDYGAYEGRTRVEIAAQIPGWTVWTHPIPGGESASEVSDRADRVLERARLDTEAGDVILVGHGHFSRVLVARWLRLPATSGVHFGLDAAGIAVLGDERGEPQIEHLNLPPALED